LVSFVSSLSGILSPPNFSVDSGEGSIFASKSIGKTERLCQLSTVSLEFVWNSNSLLGGVPPM
jgi:hypothetical protein